MGHNGLDFGTPKGTKILAPHSGKVVETGYDHNGYGNYVKIENDKEGSVLAHLSNVAVALNFDVKEGQLIGLSGSTGASTGPHLHWGYYLLPRDRTNGYNGFIDQMPFLTNANATNVYIPKLKIGYEIKPNIEIPVGKEPGKESFNYGKIGPSAFAKVFDVRMVNNVYYYNIDQRYIGGGTGWVKAETVDKAPLYVPPVIVEKPKEEVKEEKKLTYEDVAKSYKIKSPEELNTLLDTYFNKPKEVKIDTKEVKVNTDKKEVTVPVVFNFEWLISVFKLDQLFKGGDKK